MAPLTCPECGEEIPPDTDRCPACGHLRDGEPGEPEPDDEAGESQHPMRPGDLAALQAAEAGGLPGWGWFLIVFAVIAIALSAVAWSLIVVIGGSYDDIGAPESDDTTGTPAMVVSIPPVEQGALSVGTCIDWDEYDKAVDDEPFIRLRCVDPHDAEIYYLYDFPEGPYPGEDAVTEAMQERCNDEFWVYVGDGYDEESEQLNTSTWWPTETGWGNGYRTGTCLLARADGGKLTGSRYRRPGVAAIRRDPTRDN